MTMHRLTAGAGYRYLLRHIATGDCTRAGKGKAPVSSYYTESGNPPGRWMGRGLPGFTPAGPAAISAGTVVGEEAMARLFAHGLNPADGTALGRGYPAAVPAADRVAARVEALPAEMTTEARQAAVEAITRVELGRDARPAVAGFDLTFTVVKSASTLWALGDAKTQQQVYDAHITAVSAALDFLQDRALYTRTGAAGCRQETTRGAIAAGFHHWDSRAGDPNLHTHVVLANKVQGTDGRWRSLDSRALHHAVVAVSELYEAFFVDEMARRLPVRWGWRGRGPRRSPAFELDGVDDELMVLFSRRSTQIDEAMTTAVTQFTAAHGRAPNRIEILKLRERATVSTRPAKEIRPLGQLISRWRRRGSNHTGLTPEQLTARVVHNSHTRPLRRCDVPVQVIDDLAGLVLDGVRERRSTWTRWNLAAETLRVTKPLIAATTGDRLAILDAVTDAALTRCISLQAPQLFTATGRYARPDGTTVFERPDECAYTDTVILDAERELLDAAADTTAPTARVLTADLLIDGLRALAADQESAARHIAASARLVDVLVGPAGSGKTTTLAAVRQVWERWHGRRSVIGLAPSSTAAANLAGALGISCENTAKWLHESAGPGGQQRRASIDRLHQERARTGTDLHRRRTIESAIRTLTVEDHRWRLQPGQLLVVDEASLAGTLALRDLARQAATAGAKVLLVGDHAQLSAVDAGGAFGLLVERTGGAQLRTLWRFTHRWEAAATTGLRAGAPRALDDYETAGRIHAGPGESMLEEAYTAWSADVTAGHTTILIAPDATTVTALNTRAHNDRTQDGLVQPGGITTATGALISTGDRVVTRLNDRRLRHDGGYVRNGDLWDVIGIEDDGTMRVVPARIRLARRGVVGTAGSQTTTPVRLPAEYTRAHVDLAYATTTHRAQGITVDRAHVLASAGMTRENLYVAMTRGRDSNHLYLTADRVDTDCDGLPDPHTHPDARDVLATILATSGAERSATATIAANLDEAASLRRLEPITRTLYADAAHDRWVSRLTDLAIPAATLTRITASPDTGRLFAILDRVDALADSPREVIARLTAALDPDEPAEALRHRAQNWLRRNVDEPADLPNHASTDGMGDDGRTLLDQIEELVRDRQMTLTTAALDAPPNWLSQLGPEPPPGPDHDQWLSAVAAHAAHTDRHQLPSAAARIPARTTTR